MTEELDQVRGVLASLSNRGAAVLQPVTTSAIAAALKRRNRNFDSGRCLERLSRVGDVQRLPGGTWLPCPTSLVQCADLIIAVSGLPTSRLVTELGTLPQGYGDSRVLTVPSIAKSDIRVRDFGSWCRAPASSLRWSEALIENSQYRQGLVTEGMEWHDHVTAGKRRRWSDLHPTLKLECDPVLARLRSKHGRTEYFLLRGHGGALQMAEVKKEEGQHQRLRYALLASAGNHEKYRSSRKEGNSIEVSVPRTLPDPEAMVLAALGRLHSKPDDWEQVFNLPEASWPQVERMLRALGLVGRHAG
jgi:hypothetical protein